jgi:hypothetical protein
MLHTPRHSRFATLNILMGLIKKLFSRKAPTPAAAPSPLAELLGTLSPARASDLLQRHASDPVTERYAEPVSILVLCLAHNCAEYLRLQWRKNAGRKAELPVFRYDDTVAEFAAFMHFWLLRDYLNYEHNSYSTAKEPYFLALQNALNASARILGRHLPHLQDGQFQTKTMSYGMPTLMEKDAVLARLVIRAQVKHAETTQLPHLEAAMHKTSQWFHEQQLPELEKTIWALYQTPLSRDDNTPTLPLQPA